MNLSPIGFDHCSILTLRSWRSTIVTIVLVLVCIVGGAGRVFATDLLEGDVAHKADIVRSTYKVKGAGVKVCVVSDSIDDGHGALAAARTVGAVPNEPQLTALSGQEGTGSGEGLAMLEIIHKLAPDATLEFATGGIGRADIMAKNIRALAASSVGCKIIVDDETYHDQPPFQDGGTGTISAAINEATKNGVIYFSSAGNFGSYKYKTSTTWEGNYADGGAGSIPVPSGLSTVTLRGHWLQFAPNTPFITVKSRAYEVSLFWSDPWGDTANAANPYWLFATDSQNNLLGFSAVPSPQPRQYIVMARQPGRNYLDNGDRLYVMKPDGSAPRFLHLSTYGGKLDSGSDGSTAGHNAAANAITVAAADVPTNPTRAFSAADGIKVEPDSSDGQRLIFFEPDGTAINGGRMLKKPDLTAAACVHTTLPPDNSNHVFCGTSAAAPHAAAIAALLLSYEPSLTAAQVKNALAASAIDIEAKGWDQNSGAGIVMADKAFINAEGVWSSWRSLGGGIAFNAANCVSWGPRRIDCFANHNDLQMYHSGWDGNAWSGWEGLGGQAGIPPSCVSWGPNRIDCFTLGAMSEDLMHRWWDGNSWGGWENLGSPNGPPVAEQPSCVSWGANRIDCFGRTGAQLSHRWWDGGSWRWENLGGNLDDAPVCLSVAVNRLDCFGRDRYMMVHLGWNGRSWDGWEDLGGFMVARPSCVGSGTDRIDCFALADDKTLYHRASTSVSWGSTNGVLGWNGWDNLNQGAVMEVPNCVSAQASQIDCFARSPDQTMAHLRWNGTRWGPWENLGEDAVADLPQCLSSGPKRIDCFARGPDRSVYDRWRAN